jgi:hypothetical protein
VKKSKRIIHPSQLGDYVIREGGGGSRVLDRVVLVLIVAVVLGVLLFMLGVGLGLGGAAL